MQEVQRLAHMSIAQAGEPARVFGAQCVDMASDRFDKQQFAESGQDAFATRPASFRFRPRCTDQKSKSRILAI